MGFCFDNPNSIFNYIDENKFIYFLTSFTFLVIFIFIYILRAYTFFERRKIPQAARPFAPFGNIKEVIFQEITLYVYLLEYYNKFKRKGYKYGGLYLFFKPSVFIINPALMQKITKEENICDVPKSVLNYKIIDLFKDDNMENFLQKYNMIKDSFITDLNEENMFTVFQNFVTETTFAAFGFKRNLNLMSVVGSSSTTGKSAGFKHYFSLVYPVFQRDTKPTQQMQDIIKDIVDFRKKNDITEKDLIQSFIELYNKGDSNFDEIVSAIFSICAENIIYTYNSLLFCLYELGLHSSKIIQQNLLQEIKGLNESTDLKALQQLPYLDAVVKETLRKYPPIPTIIKRCKDDYKDEAFNIELPKDTLILFSVMGVHHDPTIFPEPFKFNPDRFLGCKECDAYIPFGGELREQIAMKFTTLQIKLIVISIISSYNIRLYDDNYVLEFDNTKLSPYPKEPLPILLKPL